MRERLGLYFTLSEINSVISRGAKGIKYLYDIFHHHGAISSRAFTWPITQNSNESIQLIDEWAFFIDNRENRYKNLRPKDELGAEEKNMQKCTDLGNLGLVGKEMLSVGNGVNILKGGPGYSNLMEKIQVLTGEYRNRYLIYDMISNNNVSETIGLDLKAAMNQGKDAQLVNNSNQIVNLPSLNHSVSVRQDITNRFPSTISSN
jgi:hypothetical protein